MTGNEKELKFIRKQVEGECEPGLKRVSAFRQSIRAEEGTVEIRRRVCGWCVYNVPGTFGEPENSGYCGHPSRKTVFNGDGSSPCIDVDPWFTARFLKHWILNQFVGINRTVMAPEGAIGVAFARRDKSGRMGIDIHHFPQAEYPMAQIVQVCSSIAYRFIYKRWDDYTGENQT